MIALPSRLISCAAAALALSAPSAAQQNPQDFQLPPPTPTPTPAPAGPADERGGVVIPPRPVPVPTPTATASPLPAPSLPTPLTLPTPRPAPTPTATASAAPNAAAAQPTPAPSPEETAAPTPVPGDPVAAPPTAPSPLPLPAPDGPTADPDVPENASSQSALPDWWPYAAALLAALLALAGGIAIWRSRHPKVLHLAAPPPGMESADAPAPELPRLDVTLDIISATRSMMKFTLAYRINLANRTDRAVSDLNLAVQLASARRAGDNAPSSGAARQVLGVTRIGPHQNRSVSGEIQLPLADIEILRQGSAALFIPLLHVTLEGEGQSPLSRSFVIGNPSASGSARLHPIRLDQPPGSVPGLRAQPIAIPES